MPEKIVAPLRKSAGFAGLAEGSGQSRGRIALEATARGYFLFIQMRQVRGPAWMLGMGLPAALRASLIWP